MHTGDPGPCRARYSVEAGYYSNSFILSWRDPRASMWSVGGDLVLFEGPLASGHVPVCSMDWFEYDRAASLARLALRPIPATSTLATRSWKVTEAYYHEGSHAHFLLISTALQPSNHPEANAYI